MPKNFVYFDFEAENKDVYPASIMRIYDSPVSFITLLADGKKLARCGKKLSGLRIFIEDG